MNDLKNIVDQILDGKKDKGIVNIEGYSIGVELIKVFNDKYICITYLGADMGKIYSIDYINECYDEAIFGIEKDFGFMLL